MYLINEAQFLFAIATGTCGQSEMAQVENFPKWPPWKQENMTILEPEMVVVGSRSDVI